MERRMSPHRYVGFLLTAALACVAGCSSAGDDPDHGGFVGPDASTSDAKTDATLDAGPRTDATSAGDAEEDGTVLDGGTADAEASTDAEGDPADSGSGLRWRAYLPLTAGSNGNGAGITADVSGN